jgi:hypothetical protein
VLIKTLIRQNQTIVDNLYCSNLNASSYLDFPIFSSSDSGSYLLPVTGANSVPGQTEATVTHRNFLKLISLATTQQGPPGASSGLLKKPCVYNLNSAYLDDDPLYTSDQSAFRQDSTFFPTPINGFINNAPNPTIAQYLAQYQTLPFYVYAADPSIQTLGTNPNTAPFVPIIYPSTQFKNASSANGLLDTIERRYYVNLGTVPKLQTVPWFNNTNGITSDSLNTYIGALLSSVISQLAAVNNSALTSISPSEALISINST